MENRKIPKLVIAGSWIENGLLRILEVLWSSYVFEWKFGHLSGAQLLKSEFFWIEEGRVFEKVHFQKVEKRVSF